MHYEVHDSSGTPLLLLHGGPFDIHQQFGELLAGNSQNDRSTRQPPRRRPEARPSTGLDNISRLWRQQHYPLGVDQEGLDISSRRHMNRLDEFGGLLHPSHHYVTLGFGYVAFRVGLAVVVSQLFVQLARPVSNLTRRML
jgi:hypothetical protein